MSGSLGTSMQRQQRTLYNKIESEIRKETIGSKDANSNLENYVTCIQITSMNTRNRASQLVILLAGPYGDLVTFEDENNAWIISTRKYRSAALRKLVEDLTPRIRKRWTTSPYALRHLVLYDIPLSASNYPPFTGASHVQVQAEHDNGDLVYALADSDHMVAARFINNCGTISLEIERNPGLQLDSVRLEKLTASDFTESERFEEALSDPCCCCLIS